MFTKFLSAKKGFNFPELAMSMLILATVVVLILGIFIGGVLGVRKSTNQITITNALLATIDQYSQAVLYDFDNPLYINGKSYKISEEKIIDKTTIIEKWVEFEESGTKPTNRLKHITVTIYWYDKGVEGLISKRKMSFTTGINNYLTYK
ncbi:MAG TPA: hypothetical protein PL110_16085 [Candidatus Eremiobacteraeota bacterium]|nr:MAG: hypothetical protein BWY64_03628 [bacterium ADurb.Bin363]HPZ09622.1 hypothetical protein [Candidatus Eremiobacteraeota bacterium]